ncbi:MAG: pilus assembly FimT family protein [Gemmatimonadaceae bacterium]
MMRKGTTAIEMVITLTIIALMLGMVVPSFLRFRDGIAVRNAAAEAVTAFAIARQSAIVRGEVTRVGVDKPPGHVTVSVAGAPIMRRDLEGTYGVLLSSTRDSTAYSPLGLGHGAANLRMLIERGRVAETIFVSREGRVRRR